MIKIITGNIFATQCQTIVNTINCVGVMGAGIAYEFRLRYPQMYKRYVELCDEKKINIGNLWLFKSEEKWIINFPTKYHWKTESKVEYLEKGLQKFIDTYKMKGINSIAFPLLGASNGGLSVNVSLDVMIKYLSKCDIDIEIYKFDPLAYDDVYIQFKELWNTFSEREIAKNTGLRTDLIKKIKIAIENDNMRSINQLLSIKGIGDVSLEKSFQFVFNAVKNNPQTLKFE